LGYSNEWVWAIAQAAGRHYAFTDLLSIFEKVGLDLRGEIDAYFSRYNK